METVYHKQNLLKEDHVNGSWWLKAEGSHDDVGGQWLSSWDASCQNSAGSRKAIALLPFAYTWQDSQRTWMHTHKNYAHTISHTHTRTHKLHRSQRPKGPLSCALWHVAKPRAWEWAAKVLWVFVLNLHVWPTYQSLPSFHLIKNSVSLFHEGWFNLISTHIKEKWSASQFFCCFLSHMYFCYQKPYWLPLMSKVFVRLPSCSIPMSVLPLFLMRIIILLL